MAEQWKAGRFRLETGARTLIMGILNFTPDSFSDGGAFFRTQACADRAAELEREGADVIDLGANSTRPGAEILDAAAELDRLGSVLPAVRAAVSVPLSVETFYPECAAFALKNGADIINDVSGTFNGEIAQAVKAAGAGLILTHAPKRADEQAEYPDGAVVAVRNYFLDCMKQAYAAGLPLDSLCLDPGIGFGKSRADDAELLRNVQWLRMQPCPLLIGLSRKRITKIGSSAPADRDFATAAANTAAIAGGAEILRVHNVAAAVQAARMADLIFRNGENHG